MRVVWIIACAIVATLLLAEPAAAEKRVALVIGNASYVHAGELKNPSNDAADVAAALKALGFTLVGDRAYRNLDKASMDRAVRDFAQAMVGADIGLFFYAGHGMQVNGVNYLVPTDAQLSNASALDFEMVRLDVVQRQMEREAKTNVLFLDACRDNPLARNLARSMGTRSADIGRGLAGAESGVGTLISFATQPGNVALDGEGRNSPFTTALIKHIGSNQDLSGILIAVRNEVRATTAGRQVPWENSALTGRFYFRNGGTQSAPPQASPQTQDEAAKVWSVIQNTNSVAVLEDYVRQFGSSVYGSIARARIAELKENQLAAVPPTAPFDPRPSDIIGRAGALAVGVPADVADEGFAYGWDVDAPNAAVARAKAMANCRNQKSRKAAARCQLVKIFKDECFAVAMDPRDGTAGVGWAVAPTQSEAQRQALAACHKTAGDDDRRYCAISESKCNGGAR
jgi:hypothetical protein